MMTRKTTYIVSGLLVIIVAGGAYVWWCVPLVHFQAVRVDARQRLIASGEPLTHQQADRVVAVLQQYDETYRRADAQTVLITPALSMDMDLIWNYTSKASLSN